MVICASLVFHGRQHATGGCRAGVEVAEQDHRPGLREDRALEEVDGSRRLPVSVREDVGEDGEGLGVVRV
jgi:hypothetical protein